MYYLLKHFTLNYPSIKMFRGYYLSLKKSWFMSYALIYMVYIVVQCVFAYTINLLFSQVDSQNKNYFELYLCILLSLQNYTFLSVY